MAGDDIQDTGFQRRQLIVMLLKKHFDESPEVDTVVFDPKELGAKHDLLKDLNAVTRALETLREELKPDFTFKLNQFVARRVGTRHVGSSDGIKISVDSKKKLDDYLKNPWGTGLHFDPVKSRFYVKGKEVKIQKFSDQYHALDVIFKNPADVAQEWFFSEIAEKLDVYKPGGDKTYYNAVHQIKLKLAAEGLREVFITTRQSAKINPKYLS